MKNNVLKYIVIAALLVNAATLIFFWLRHQEVIPQRRPFEVLIEELQLDSAQQKSYKLLRESHHKDHDRLLRNMAEQRKILYSQKQTINDTIIHKIGLLQEEIEMLTYLHFEAIRDICNISCCHHIADTRHLRGGQRDIHAGFDVVERDSGNERAWIDIVIEDRELVSCE